MTPPTDQEMEHYPYRFYASDMPWDPTILDSYFLASDILLDENEATTPYYHPSHNYGEIIKYQTKFHEIKYDIADTNVMLTFYSNPHEVQNFNVLKLNFGLRTVCSFGHSTATTETL